MGRISRVKRTVRYSVSARRVRRQVTTVRRSVRIVRR